MLFDKIPFLYGSGVIPRQFVAIRETVKATIMKTFFDQEYLSDYINDRARGMISELDLGSRIKDGMNKPEFDTKLVAKMEDMATKVSLLPTSATQRRRRRHVIIFFRLLPLSARSRIHLL